MGKRAAIVWFRQDLRLHDNEALTDAIQQADEILPVYIFDPGFLPAPPANLVFPKREATAQNLSSKA